MTFFSPENGKSDPDQLKISIEAETLPSNQDRMQVNSEKSINLSTLDKDIRKNSIEPHCMKITKSLQPSPELHVLLSPSTTGRNTYSIVRKIRKGKYNITETKYRS